MVVILVQPLVIQPLFNRFEPLGDRALARNVELVAQREGVTIDRVEVADASRRTTTANAYVAGIGPTKRVVFYDIYNSADYKLAYEHYFGPLGF